ncbi:lipoate--protein ligase [uncultured Oscillibacter sp.]|uniref:lipoate--protein ligase n=1 Tax=uncultured Oscillibacter sp. TaxID=876091 RepID=UPI0025EB72BC|nr:lipoate--protein ligase [uncultured Oscillibacter sp.]
MKMRFLESPSNDPYFNLALEEYVFEHLDRSYSYFMLWQNFNTIVVGKYQNTAEEINQSFVDEHGIRVVRRLSGGGAVFHDRGNLNFTFIVDQGSNPDFNFKVFVEPVVQALDRFGIHAEFNGRNDITIDGMKFSGNSQYTRHGRLLHHGCIMLDSNLTNVADALKVKDAKFDSKAVKSVRSRVTTINSHASVPISMEDFKRALTECAMDSGELEPYTLTEKDLEAVRQLREQKYSTWEWNYGQSPAYDMRKEMKFPAGLITACLSAEAGKIKALRFYGDFFGNGDLEELEQAMVGLPLDEHLESALEPLHVERYISGITAGELARLLRY